MGRLLGRLGAKIEAPTDIRSLRGAEFNRPPAAGQLDNETTLRGDLFRLAAFATTPSRASGGRLRKSTQRSCSRGPKTSAYGVAARVRIDFRARRRRAYVQAHSDPDRWFGSLSQGGSLRHPARQGGRSEGDRAHDSRAVPGRLPGRSPYRDRRGRIRGGVAPHVGKGAGPSQNGGRGG